MQASVQAYNYDQSSYLSEINQCDEFPQCQSAEYADNNSFWLSPDDNSSDSPSSSSSAVEQQPVTDFFIKQEQPPSAGYVKREPLTDDEAIADDECKQGCMNPLYFPTTSYRTCPPSLTPLNLPFTNPEPQPYQPTQPTFFQSQPDASASQLGCPVVAEDLLNPVKTEKKPKLDSPARRRTYRHDKLTESIAGSPPLPPDLELPAILGGKLPPRTLKNGNKRKHVYTERELRSRRKRGLPDDSDSESEERRLVRLPRRSLLTITTPQMSRFVAFMRTAVKLTPSQDDELSKQKRLVKNRECACRFRAKKELSLIEYRERVIELEGDLEALRAENERLRQALSQVSVLQQQQQVATSL